MIKIVKYLFVLLLLVILSSLFISFGLNQVYDRTYTGQSGGKINYLLKQYEQVNVLAIGNSRCAHHIVPTEISENSFNLSHNGMSLIFHLGLADQLIRNETIEIDTLLLHLELHEIFNTDFSIRDIQHLKYYYNKNTWITSQINQLSQFEQLKYLFAAYKWNGKVMSLLNNGFKSMSQNNIPEGGYVSISPNERDSINVMWDYNNQDKQPPFYSDGISKQFITHIEYLNELCQQKGIALVCFTSPVFKAPKGINSKHMKELTAYFKANNILYLNYFEAYNVEKELQNIWNWKDVYHLNHNGAIAFSQNVKRDLKKWKKPQYPNDNE